MAEKIQRRSKRKKRNERKKNKEYSNAVLGGLGLVFNKSIKSSQPNMWVPDDSRQTAVNKTVEIRTRQDNASIRRQQDCSNTNQIGQSDEVTSAEERRRKRQRKKKVNVAYSVRFHG